MKLVKIWEICISFLWDQTYIRSLDKLLRDHKVKTILDCAGGTGFPSIELKKMGWDISYSDGNQQMYNAFLKKLNNKIQIPHYLVNWLELSKKIKKRFDVVLCRGNSLIYVNSWDTKSIKNETKENILRSLREFYTVLNPNGFLYVDMTNKNEYHQKYPLVEEIGEKIIDGQKIKMTWVIDHDYSKQLRTVKIRISIDNKPEEIILYSYLLRPEELIELLKKVGFRKVEEVKIKGENSYIVFIALK